MRRFGLLLLGGSLCLPAAACRRDGEGKPPPLRSAVALAARFRPPADGLLTVAQINSYVRVRRAARGRTDEEAARAVGMDPEEFAWVRARIVEALVALDARRVEKASEGTYARTIASLRETRKSVQDGETLRSIDQQIAGLELERSLLRRGDPEPVSVSENSRKLAGRRAEIEAVSP